MVYMALSVTTVELPELQTPIQTVSSCVSYLVVFFDLVESKLIISFKKQVLNGSLTVDFPTTTRIVDGLVQFFFSERGKFSSFIHNTNNSCVFLSIYLDSSQWYHFETLEGSYTRISFKQ